MRLRLISFLFFAVAILSVAGTSAAPFYHVGYQDLETPFVARVWYPISSEIFEAPIPTSPLFKSYFGKKDAPIETARETCPLLIVSHGSGGTVYRLDWLADFFVRRGWIVAGINHPGNTFGDNSAMGLVKVWERPKQVTAFLDWLLQQKVWSDRIDKNRIAFVGHSAGGAAAVLLAGARMSKGLFQDPVPLCRPQPADRDDEDCAAIKKIDFKGFDRKDVEGDYRDVRIRAAVPLDPAFARSFPRRQKLATPTEIIFAEKLKSLWGKIDARDFLRVLPKARQRTIPGSVHISFISECSEKALAEGIPLCVGDAGKRDAIHEETSKEIAAFFGEVME